MSLRSDLKMKTRKKYLYKIKNILNIEKNFLIKT